MSEESVRRLLAEAAAEPERMPADVAERLDLTLAELVAERRTSDLPSTGVIPARARGRWARRPALRLLAAAAVVVAVAGAGFAGVGLLRGQDGDDTSSTSSAASGSAPARSASPDAGGAAPSSAPTGVAPPTDDVPQFNGPARLVPPVVRRATFAADAAAALRRDPGDSLDRAPLGARTIARCLPATLDLAMDTRVRDITFDSRPALLISSPLTGGGTRVSAYACGGGTTPLASATLP